MKIRTKNGTQEITEVNCLIVYIGLERYRISKTIDKKLCINKTSDGETD